MNTQSESKSDNAKRAFVCIHGFGSGPDVSEPGFSSALRDNVRKALGGEEIVWEEVFWGDLLESPPTDSLLEFMRRVPEMVRKFYKSAEGRAIRERVGEAVGAASRKAGGTSVTLVGHSFGAAIAYETIARRKAPEAKGIVMLAPPMGLFNNPREFLFEVKEKGIACRGLATALGLGRKPPEEAVFPKVKGNRLPSSVSAVSWRCIDDLFAMGLEPDFYEVSELRVNLPKGVRGSGKHRFYWRSPRVAKSVAAMSVSSSVMVSGSSKFLPTLSGREWELMSVSIQESLFKPPRPIYDRHGNEVGWELV